MGNHPTRSLTVDSPSPFTSYGSIGESSPDLNPFQSAEFGLDFDHARQEAQHAGMLLGDGVTIAHFDDGWHLDHPYFGAYLEHERPIQFLGSSSMRGARYGHGTSVLGLHIGGFSDVLDLFPLLPGARVVLANSLDREERSSNCVLSETIELLASSRSSVLLVARDWSSRAPHLPYELRPGVAELFARAKQLGVVVVQAAGNGGLCLDNLIRRDGPAVQRQITMRSDPWLMEPDDTSDAFQIDTGALTVGASTASVPFRRWSAGFARNPQPKSNYGRRVDCCAPGEQLFTAAGTGRNGQPSYTSGFGGTSGAAAIVAAAVAAVQSLVMNATGSPLSPATVRSVFSDSELGSPVLGGVDPIGAVPNIRRILGRATGMRATR